MLNLFDFLNRETEDLLASLWMAGFQQPTVILHDDGFLPPEVLSPYQFFMGEITEDGYRVPELGMPRFFNEVPIPAFWEIEGNGLSASIRHYDTLRAKICYAKPERKREVKQVDWLDRQQRIRFSDHYNRLGRRFSQTTYNVKGEKTHQTWYHLDGSEAIVQNFVTGDFLVQYRGSLHHFPSLQAMLSFFLQEAGYSFEELFINSLGTPFFVSHGLRAEGRTTLFWQEPAQNSLPGNMKVLLAEPHRQGRVFFMNGEVSEIMMGHADKKQRPFLSKLGYSYVFARENQGRPQILILTNSDQIEKLQDLVEGLPEMEFHIGAITEMSSKLLAFGRYKNVHLYPTLKLEKAAALFASCDFYLDINYGKEILNAVRQAFNQNMLILGFRALAHNRNYTLPDYLVAPTDVSFLRMEIRRLLADSEFREERLAQQRRHGDTISLNAFRSEVGAGMQFFH